MSVISEIAFYSHTVVNEVDEKAKEVGQVRKDKWKTVQLISNKEIGKSHSDQWRSNDSKLVNEKIKSDPQ